MSAKHPVIAVTGSSGAGTTTTSLAFRKIFAQLNLHAAEVEGDSFHRYTRPEMDMAIRKARDQGKHISYFGPEANDFGLLEQTFVDYGRHGKGQSRKYLHTYDEAVPWNQVPGTFTPGNRCRSRQTCCSMRGCTAGLSRRSMMSPAMSTCWSGWCLSLTSSGSKAYSRHQRTRPLPGGGDGLGRPLDGRLHQLHYPAIFPHPYQLSARADGGHLQPVCRQSDPLAGRELCGDPFPQSAEYRFPWLLAMLQGSFISHMNTLVVPGGKMGLAMELIMTPLVERLMEGRKIG